MTQTEREQVEKLRKQGVGYAAIAARVGLSENTVKSYCRRKTQLLPEFTKEQEGICPHCGAPLPEKVRGKPRRFCSDACRAAWWYAHRSPSSITALARIPCAACGKPFHSKASAGRKYCCHGCYIKDRYKNTIESEVTDNDERAV